MTTTHHFQIGDRVRVISASRYPEQIGKETTVIGFDREYVDGSGRVTVEVDLPAMNPHARACGNKALFLPESLRLIYDGHEPCAWDESLFNPFKESARV